MNGRQMHYICTIAETGNIQKAAVQLGKSPSTLTRVLKNSEDELGTVLFKRTHSQMILTSEGEAVIFYFQNLLKLFSEINIWVSDGKSEAVHEWTENEVRYLLSIREWRNISKAADDLYLAQPSLSQMIHEVEEDLGKKIFYRSKDGVMETEFGTVLLNRLQNVQKLYRNLKIELEEFQQMRKGSITFGIPLNLGTYLLPLVVPEYRERFPGIKIRIRENNSRDLEEMMIKKKIDFCILHFHEAKNLIHYEMFFEDPFYLVIPKKDKSRLGFPENQVLQKEELQKLQKEPFVMVASRQKLRMVVDQILEQAGIKPDICCTTKSMETVKRLVAAGMGVTFLPRSYLTLYSEADGLASYPIDKKLNGSWMLATAYPEEEKLPRSSREFLKLLQEILKKI